MSWRRLWAMARKELRHIVRDARSLGLALAMPLLMLLLFGYALTLDVDRVSTLIFDQDGTALSRQLIERFAASRYFEIQGMAHDYGEIERAIDANRILLGIIIPQDYSRAILSGGQAEVQLLLDGSDSNTASIAQGYAEGLIRGYGAELRARAINVKTGHQPARVVDPRFRVLFNSTLESKNYVVPGLIAVILTIISALLTSLTIAREWEMGTMEQLLSTPVRAAEMVLGKMLAYFFVGLADTVIAVSVGLVLFRVPLRGSVLLLAVASCVFLSGALFWGIFISAATRSQLQAYQAGLFSTFLPAFLLSGFVYDLDSMPAVIQFISRITPARYFVSMIKGIFLKGAGMELLWPELVFLLLYSGIVFALAARKLSHKIA